MMRKAIIYACLLGCIVFTTNAQEVNIRAIPYTMHFENNPLDYKILGDSSIQISAPENTDLFISPDGGYETNKSPRLLFKPDSDFIFTSGIKLDFNSKWDAGVLLIYNDSRYYAKFCFEKDYKGQPRVVTVVCNESGDDCNSVAIDAYQVFYRMIGSSKGKSFAFYYTQDKKSWYLIRTFKLDKADNISIGFSAQSPAGKGCKVDFVNIDFQQRKPADFWEGN